MKTKTIPFDLETAKKIQVGDIEGRIVTNHDVATTLLDAEYRFGGEYNIPVIWHWEAGHNELVLYNNKGECKNSHRDCYLHIELPEEALKTFHVDIPKGHAEFHGDATCFVTKETPKHEFKPFDKVLVREQSTDEWKCDYFSHAQNDGVCTYYVCIGGEFLKCVPFEGNEYLVGTTDKPREE